MVIRACCCLITHLPWVHGKGFSTLTHFPLALGCEDYSFSDQAAADSKHSFDSILIHPIKTLEVDASFDMPDVVMFLVSSGFLHLVNAISHNSELQCAHSIKLHEVWYQARVLLLPYPW